MSAPVAKCRLYAILARSAPRAVIFRRGPSQHVLLCLWHTDTDRVEEGQWLRGRVYERRGDLSPNGTRLVYFAAQWSTTSARPGGPGRERAQPADGRDRSGRADQWRKPLGSWTALSTPPWWTAQAIWPNGSAWGGGGLFDDDRTLSINGFWDRSIETPESRVPKDLTVRQLGGGGGGEDRPIWDARLSRDGWRVVSRGTGKGQGSRKNVMFAYEEPAEWGRASPTERGLELRMRILGIGEKNGDWYVVEHRVVRGNDVVLDLGRAEWADWDRSGDLLFANDGVMHRLKRTVLDLSKARVVIDLRDRRFEARPAPAEIRAHAIGGEPAHPKKRRASRTRP